ncbi:MAG: single-stranded DNA-binding protein [Proteobacteria bacterium]|nr:single-stranded DNA-binding protein [Pseudomonadota bacterium]
MTFYNKVILIGNLAENPDSRYTPDGSQVIKLSLRIRPDGRSGQARHPQIIDVIAFEKDGEPQWRSLTRGCWVLVEGKIQSRSWETAEGQKKKTLEIIAERVYPLKDEEALRP